MVLGSNPYGVAAISFSKKLLQLIYLKIGSYDDCKPVYCNIQRHHELVFDLNLILVAEIVKLADNIHDYKVQIITRYPHAG